MVNRSCNCSLHCHCTLHSSIVHLGRKTDGISKGLQKFEQLSVAVCDMYPLYWVTVRRVFLCCKKCDKGWGSPNSCFSCLMGEFILQAEAFTAV